MQLTSSSPSSSPTIATAASNGHGSHQLNGKVDESSMIGEEGEGEKGRGPGEWDKAITNTGKMREGTGGGAQVGRHHSIHSQTGQSTRSRSSSTSTTTQHFQHKQNKPQQILKSLKHFSERAKKSLHLSTHHEEHEGEGFSGESWKEGVKRRGSERCHHHHHHHRGSKSEVISEEEEEGEGEEKGKGKSRTGSGGGSGGVSFPNVFGGGGEAGEDDDDDNDKFEERRNIKIRLVTWNMHDSLPTGDLTDFLGEVKGWKESSSTSNNSLSTSNNNRKSNGIIGGGSRASSEGKRRPSTTGSKKSMGTTGTVESTGGASGSVISLPTIGPDALPPFPLTPEHPYHLIIVAGQECPTASGVTSGKLPRTWDGQGWTTILEEWLCGANSDDSDFDSDGDGDEEEGSRSRSRERGKVSGSEEGGDGVIEGSGGAELKSSKSSRTGTTGGGGGEGASLKSRGNSTVVSGRDRDREGTDNGDARNNGPYILVEKERLLGIYLAVFVARSCDGLIEGISKARVPAGLIGGRVGNKGACGISLNFAGSRLLFISAHLAAHASGLEIRKMNVKKIMEELEVDDFRGNSGKSEGKALSDRFDQTFFLGDLNMRLNITRLHADWLTKSQDYATALQFDQLRGVLAEEKSCLKGFQEAPITFAPTYKYDVVSKVKRKRSEATPRSPRSPTKKTVVQPAIDVFDMDPLTTVPSAVTDPEVPPTAARDPDNVSLVDSIASAMSDYDRIDKADLVTLGLPSAPSKGGDTSMDAVRRAQVKFLTLVRANSSAAVLNHSATSSGASTPRRNLFGSSPAMLSARPILRSAQSDLVIPLARNTPPISTEVSDDDDEDEAVAPCFDSSSKQRVQSYTDRILFKSTVGYGTADTTSPSRNLGVDFVDTLRARRTQSIPPVASNDPLAPHHPHHPLFSHRPVLDHASKKVGTFSNEQSWSDVASVAGEPRHRRFANFFGRGHRRGLAEPTADTFTSPPPSPTDTRTPTPGRSASFTPNYSMSRRSSYAAPRQSSVQFDLASSPPVNGTRPDSVARTSSGSALPAVTSSPTLVSFPFGSASNTSTAQTTPAVGPSPSSSPRTNSSPRKTQRSFSMAESTQTGRPSLSPNADSDPLIFPRRMSLDPTVQFDQGDSSLSTFIRSNALSLTRTFTRTQSRATTVTPHNRFKSFFHMIPLPFLSTTRSATESEPEKPPPREKIGPKRGEIQALLYGAVADLNKMGGQSDHRPVYSVVAIGVGDDDE